MKYWVFQSNQVTGPFDPDDLSQVPGYGAEALVCPEGRKGTNMGDWQRASMVPELSLSLLKATRLAATVGAGPGPRILGSLPPEPTLKDLAALGSLQEKVSLLEGATGALQEALRLKETEILSLHRELEQREAKAEELKVKLASVEERLGAVAELRQSLDKASSDASELQGVVSTQKQTIEVLNGELHGFQDRLQQMEQMKGQVEELRNRRPEPAPAPAVQPPPVFSAPEHDPAARFAPPPEHRIPAPEAEAAPAPALEAPAQAPAFEAPAQSPALEVSTPSPAREAPAAAPVLEISSPPLGASPEATMPPTPAPEPVNFMASAPPPPAGSGFLDPTSFNQPVIQPGVEAVPAGAEAAAPAPIVGEMAEKPKSGSGKVVAVVLVLALLAGGGVAFQLGLIPGSKHAAPAASAPAPAPAPAPEETPAQPAPAADAAEVKKEEAIALVKGWSGPEGRSLGETLQSPVPAEGGLSPWMSEKIREGVYQVNYYVPRTPGATAHIYEFEARLDDRKVLAHNDAARELLAGKSGAAAAHPAKAKRKKAAGPAAPAPGPEGALLDESLGMDGAPAPAASAQSMPLPGAEQGAPAPEAAKPAGKPRKMAKAPKQESLDDLLAEDKGKPKRKASSKKEESLDQLLLPGFAKSASDLKEPQAQPTKPAPGEVKKAAAKAAAKSGGKGKGKAADAALLDDLLR